MFKITPETDNGKSAKPASAEKPKAAPAPKPDSPPKTVKEPKTEKAKVAGDTGSINRVAADRDSAKKNAATRNDARRDSIKIATIKRDSVESAARAIAKAQSDAEKEKKAAANAVAKAQADSIKTANAGVAPPKQTATTKPNKNTPVVAAAPPIFRQPEPIIEAPVVEPPAVASDSTGIARLVHAAALWNVIRLYHPSASQHLAWDNATVRHITDVRGARSRNEYANAIREWLNTLGDHETRLQSAADVAPVARPYANGKPTFEVVIAGNTPAKKNTPSPADTTVIITWPIGVAANDSGAWSAMQSQSDKIARAAHVVIDLRAQGASVGESDNTYATAVNSAQNAFASKFASMPAIGPSVRRRAYEGWPDERVGIATPFGKALWRVSNPLSVVPAGATPIANRKVVVIADSSSEIPAALLALISTRQATLIADNGINQRAYVPSTVVSLGEGLTARVRLGELLNADGSVGVQPDSTINSPTSREESTALKTAVLIARGALTISAPRRADYSNDALYANADWRFTHYPIMGARLLSAFKLWGTVREFHAYRDLHDENIDAALLRIIPRVEAAKTADAYAGAMLDFATVMDDAQATLTSPSVTQHFGSGWAPFRARWIEGRAIVTQVTNDVVGLSIGDEITAADGYPMPAYVAERRRYGAASNDWTRMRNIMDALPRGIVGDASYRVRDASNRDKPVTLQRTTQNATRFSSTERYGTPVSRVLSSGIGYIDLARATSTGLDSAFRSLASSTAIIFDARGVGSNNAEYASNLQYILQRLSTQSVGATDKQSIRVATEPCLPADQSIVVGCVQERRQFDGAVYADTTKRYRGRTVMLIDERTQGVLEQFGLALESVGNTTFVGTSSAGASGSVTGLMLPGQMTLTFSGSEIRHADGRQLQRVGITPQVDARPTVKGIRAGSDEVLLRAQQYLQDLINPPVRKK
ncbi:MAG: S41 family peptidase [Gemmatimonadaceae bacterium]